MDNRLRWLKLKARTRGVAWCRVSLAVFAVTLLANAGCKRDVELGGGELPRIEFGMIEIGSTVTGDFRLENPTSEPLEVVDIHVSCGCLQIGKPNRTVMPGESALLPYSMEIAHAGPTLQEAVLTTSSPKYGPIRLRFSGIGKGLWSYIQSHEMGAYPSVTDSAGSEKTSHKIPVFAAGYPNAEIDRIDIGEQCIQYRLESLSADMSEKIPNDLYGIRKGILDQDVKGWTISLSWGDTIPKTGSSSTLLSVYSQEAGLLEIPIYYIGNRVTVSPGSLVFATVQPGEEMLREAFIERNSSNCLFLHHVTVSSDNSCVVVATDEVEQGIRLTCRATIDEQAEPGIIEGIIVGIHGRVELFKLPYLIVVEEAS